MARVAVVGLGKLGLPIAAVLAAAGHDVRGVDHDRRIIELLESGRTNFEEPGLDSLLKATRGGLTFTINYADALADAEFSIIIVPTPSTESGRFCSQQIEAALHDVGTNVSHGVTAPQHTVVVASTVSPGTTDRELTKAIEKAAHQSLDDDLALVYSPQFIALGGVVADLRTPDLVLIGSASTSARHRYASLLATVVEQETNYCMMSALEAEIAKIAVNSFVTMKISFANFLSEFCEDLGMANVDRVTQAIGHDTRIGHKYLRGGLGFGGPCFPRDNRALAAAARELGLVASLAEATDVVNFRQPSRVLNLLSQAVPPPARVQVWGRSYKPGTSVDEESQGILIAERAKELGYTVEVVGRASELTALAPEEDGADIRNSDDALPDAVIIATPWTEFIEQATRLPSTTAIIDPWGVLTRDPSLNLYQPGRQVQAPLHRLTAP